MTLLNVPSLFDTGPAGSEDFSVGNTVGADELLTDKIADKVTCLEYPGVITTCGVRVQDEKDRQLLELCHYLPDEI